jgi:acylaminoacyl-peptidase
MLDDLIENVLDDVRVDEVAFGLDDFLKWHREATIVTVARLFRLLLFASALHAADPFTLDDWWAWREVSDVRIRPDGSSVVWVEKVYDREKDATCASLWMTATTGGAPRRLNEGGCRASSPRWSLDGHRLAYISDHGGPFANGVAQVWVRGFIDSRPHQITRLDGPPLAFSLAPDGTAIAYTARLADTPAGATPARVALFVAPAMGGAPVRVPVGNLEIFGEPAWMPDGKSILISAAEPGASPAIYDVPPNLAGARQISHHHEPALNPVASPDGSRIAWIARGKSTKLHIANADGSREKILAGALDRDVTHIQWSSDSRTVYFLADDRGATYVWAARADGSVRQVTTARQRLFDFSLADNGRAAALRSAGEIAVFPVDQRGEAVTVAVPNASLLASRAVAAAEEIQFSSAGRKIQGWVLKSPSFDRARKYPLIVHVRDAPRRMCGPEFDLRTQIFAARGFVVLCANARGAPGFGEEFANLLPTADPGDDFDDLMRGADYLVDQGYIDGARIHIIGGLLAAWAIGQTERFRSAVAIDPVVVRGVRSALASASRFKTPTLVIDTASAPGSEELYKALQANRVPSALVSIIQDRRLQLEATLAWLAK